MKSTKMTLIFFTISRWMQSGDMSRCIDLTCKAFLDPVVHIFIHPTCKCTIKSCQCYICSWKGKTDELFYYSVKVDILVYIFSTINRFTNNIIRMLCKILFCIILSKSGLQTTHTLIKLYIYIHLYIIMNKIVS